MKNFRMWYIDKRGRGIIVVAAMSEQQAKHSLTKWGTLVTRCEQIPDYCSVSYTVAPLETPRILEAPAAPDSRQLSLFPEVSQ